MSEKSGGKDSECAARIFCDQLDGVRGKGKLFLADKDPRAAPVRFRGKVVSVCPCADEADEQNPHARIGRIVGDIRNGQGRKFGAFRIKRVFEIFYDIGELDHKTPF